MRILVTGQGGQLGFELVRCLQPLGEIIGVGASELDLREPRIASALDRLRPQLIVNAAAYTAVDRAESEPDIAMRVNGEAPTTIGAWARDNGAALIHYSTDYVFGGERKGAYKETDPTEPRSSYGRSKLAGEHGLMDAGAPAVILRTSWVYAARGSNFLRTMLRLSRERAELRVVSDQHGAPTWARSIAEATTVLIARLGQDARTALESTNRLRGIYHLSCGGSTTWHGFAQTIFQSIPDAQRRLERLVPIPTTEYPTPAVRPANSVLDCSLIQSTFGIRMPHWSEALRLLSEERSAESILHGTCSPQTPSPTPPTA